MTLQIDRRDLTNRVYVGPVCAHFVIALSLAALYSLVFHLESESIRLPEWVARGAVETMRAELGSFSRLTLATLGYGDILPSSSFTQMLAALEAVDGQFRMTVFVAWLGRTFISHHFVGGR